MIFSVEKVIEGLFSRLFLAKKVHFVHKTCTFFTCVHVSVSGPFFQLQSARFLRAKKWQNNFVWNEVVEIHKKSREMRLYLPK